MAEMQAAKHSDDLKIHRRQAAADDGVLALLKDGVIHFLGDIADDFLDAGGVDAAIGDEPDHGFAGDLAANRIEAGEQDRAGGIINQDGNARGGFEGADVTPFAANDAAFDVIALEGNRGGCVFESVLSGVTLDGERDDAPGLVLGF